MDNNRQIAKQLFDKHFMFKENPIAWTAWKMAFQLGIEHQQKLHKAGGSRRYSFAEKEPNIGDYISLVWEDGSDCECTYDGLDRSILPLPTHWYYVAENGG